ncbi:MAG: dipeptidase [Candidatus Kapaibacteriota bacterium]
MKQKHNIIKLVISIFILNTISISACTNLLVTKGASKDGSTMISYNADAGGFMEPLYFMKAQDYPEGAMLDVYDWDSGKYLGKIKQVRHTYQVIGNINEYQVSIGETTFGGREELRDTTAIIDYGSLIYIALQRAKTAREAIKIMGELVNEYGYYSEGESFSVADPNEVWILEMISKGPSERGAVWAAVRIPDGYISAHANQSRIQYFDVNDKENVMASPDVVSFAIKMKYYDEKKDGKFSFQKAYSPANPGALLFCEGRVWSLFRRAAPTLNLSTDYWRAVEGAEPYPLYIKPDHLLSVQDVISLMRDHFEGTEFDMTKGFAAGPFGNPYRWKGLTWKLSTDTVNQYAWERPISTQQTAFAFVSQLRSFLPREIGGILWYGVDDTYSNVYIPLYCSITQPPKPFVGGSIAELDLTKGFWVFNLVANLAYTKYSYIIKDIQEVQSRLENKFFEFQPAIENTAKELYKENKSLAIEYLTDYSCSQSQIVVDEWLNLWKRLVVKYNDGYINDVTIEHGRHPKGVGYGDEFFNQAIKDKPGYYDLKWRKAPKSKKK